MRKLLYFSVAIAGGAFGFLLPLVIVYASEGSMLPESARNNDIPNWANGIIGWAPSSFAMWYCWYMTAKRMPAIEKRFAEERKQSDDDTNKLVENLDKRHLEAITNLIAAFRQDVQTFWTTKREDDTKRDNAMIACLNRLEETQRSLCRFSPQHPTAKAART